jgi:hypothetical protein
MFNQDPPNLGQESVGELEVDIRQGPEQVILAAPTLGTTAWSEMGDDVNVATVHQLPAEVLVTFSRSQIFGLTGPFNWNAGVDYGLLYGVTSRCPAPGSPGVNGG